jgi:hypothetical protein
MFIDKVFGLKQLIRSPKADPVLPAACFPEFIQGFSANFNTK